MTGPNKCLFGGGKERCRKYRMYAFPGEKAQFCSTHKQPGMVDVHNKRCEAAGCDKHPTYGMANGRARFCIKHKEPSMVDVHGRPCEFENCTKHPHYAFEGDKARFCASHKEAGMVDVKHKRCHTAGCREPRVYENPSKKSRFCTAHLVEWLSSKSGRRASEGTNTRQIKRLRPKAEAEMVQKRPGTPPTAAEADTDSQSADRDSEGAREHVGNDQKSPVTGVSKMKPEDTEDSPSLTSDAVGARSSSTSLGCGSLKRPSQDTGQESPSKSRALMSPTAASGDGVKLQPIPRKVENEGTCSSSSVMEYWKSYLSKDSGGFCPPSGRGSGGARAPEMSARWSGVEAQQPEPRPTELVVHRTALSDSMQSGDVKLTPLRDLAVSGPQGKCDFPSQGGGEVSPIDGARGTDGVDVAGPTSIQQGGHVEPGTTLEEPWKRIDPGTRGPGGRALASSWARVDQTAREGDVDASASISMGDGARENSSRSLGHGEGESMETREITGQRTPSPPALKEKAQHVWRPASNVGIGETIESFRGAGYGDGSCPSVSSVYAPGYGHRCAEPVRRYGDPCDYRPTSTGDDEIVPPPATATEVIRSCESAHDVDGLRRDRSAHRSGGGASVHDGEAPLYPFFSAAGTRRARADHGGVNVFRLGGSRWDGVEADERASMDAIDRGRRPRQQGGRGRNDMDFPLPGYPNYPSYPRYPLYPGDGDTGCFFPPGFPYPVPGGKFLQPGGRGRAAVYNPHLVYDPQQSAGVGGGGWDSTDIRQSPDHRSLRAREHLEPPCAPQPHGYGRVRFDSARSFDNEEATRGSLTGSRTLGEQQRSPWADTRRAYLTVDTLGSTRAQQRCLLNHSQPSGCLAG